MLLDDAISESGVAASENASGNRLAFRPPGCRADEVVGLSEQNLDRGICHVPFAAPPQLLEDESWIRAQPRRNPTDQRLGIGGLRDEPPASLRHRAVVGGHPYHHAERTLALPLPPQPPDPLPILPPPQPRRIA